MPSQVTNPLERRAEKIARYFASLPDVEGVCLFGSIARGETDRWSDIDLLVVGQDPDLSPTKLRRALPDDMQRERLSLLYYPRPELEELFESGASFIDHLRHEGKILYDESGVLRRVFRDDFDANPNIGAELAAERARLDVYGDLGMFRGNFLFVLAQLYAIGKSVIILGLIAESSREYDRDAAFQSFKRLHPERASDVDVVSRLRPFYRIVTRRGREPLPFSYRGSEREVTAAIESIRRLVKAIEGIASQ